MHTIKILLCKSLKHSIFHSANFVIVVQFIKLRLPSQHKTHFLFPNLVQTKFFMIRFWKSVKKQNILCKKPVMDSAGFRLQNKKT